MNLAVETCVSVCCCVKFYQNASIQVQCGFAEENLKGEIVHCCVEFQYSTSKLLYLREMMLD